MGQEEGVATADLGLIKDEEECGSRGLQFVGGVGMPPRIIGSAGTTMFTETVGLGIAIDDVELGEALDVSRRSMPMEGTKVP